MTTLLSPLPIEARYTRSVHLQRDFAERSSLGGYQVTPLVIQILERILAGLELQATGRAFALIGPYGAGKSAFGVFLAHFLSAGEARRRQLMREHAAQRLPERPIYKGRTLLPVLVNGNNTSLRVAVLRAVYAALASSSKLRATAGPLLDEIQAAASANPDPQQVADLLEQATSLARRGSSHSGLLLVVDELGQFLDYAARHDERDLFVLQTLAEMAARTTPATCVILTILHQSFDRYIGTAGAGKRAEWRKVQGRYIDLPFLEPDSQLLRMVGSALCSDKSVNSAERQAWSALVAEQADRLGLRPADIAPDEWAELVARAYPLHPTALVALPPLFRQLAQNERSLFAFLSAQEPWSLPEFLLTAPRSPDGRLPIYRLPQLYAYVEATMGPSLFGRARGRRWAELAAAREGLPDLSALAVDALTCIGTIGALGQQRGLGASPELVAFALRDNAANGEAHQAVSLLRDRRVIAYRKHRDSYVLWEGSDLDLDGLAERARRMIGDQASLVHLLQQHATPAPLVAHRHSYQTGALRHFGSHFVDANGLPEALQLPLDADGETLYVVPKDDEALDRARRWAENRERASETWRVIVIPARANVLRDLLLDVAALQQVLVSQPELENDRAARLELTARLEEARQTLEEAISGTYGPGNSLWYWLGISHEARTEKQVDELLSNACDATYPSTPKIWNELIIRRQLSSAAAKARRNLIEQMLDRAHEEQLGITGYPPERAIYESIFRQSGVHRQESDGAWRFGAPSDADPLRLKPAWAVLQEYIESSVGQALPITDLYAKLAAPPYGLKAGVIPLLFVAVYLANAGSVALYEHGNYVPVPDITTFERVLRQPGHYKVRFSRVTGVRVAVFERLSRALAPKALEKRGQVAVVDAVTPLLRFTHKLPAYTKATRRVSPKAQSIRQAMLEARAPDELLFERLPEACNLPVFELDGVFDDTVVEKFFVALREGLDELQSAYGTLVAEVREKIRRAFGGFATATEQLHDELLARYRQIAAVTSDTQLRALGVRLENAGQGDAWVESVAALAGRKPLNTWRDADLHEFDTAISDLGRRFRLVEQVAIVRQTLPPETPVLRIGIADAQQERSLVVHASGHNDNREIVREMLLKSLVANGILTREQQIYAIADLLRELLEEPSVRSTQELPGADSPKSD